MYDSPANDAPYVIDDVAGPAESGITSGYVFNHPFAVAAQTLDDGTSLAAFRVEGGRTGYVVNGNVATGPAFVSALAGSFESIDLFSVAPAAPGSLTCQVLGVALDGTWTVLDVPVTNLHIELTEDQRSLFAPDANLVFRLDGIAPFSSLSAFVRAVSAPTSSSRCPPSRATTPRWSWSPTPPWSSTCRPWSTASGPWTSSARWPA